MRHVHLYIDGRVQGVGYRRYVEQQARALDVKGYVKNIEGGVEVVAEGDETAVAQLIEACKAGPTAAKVDDIQVEEGTPSHIYKDFNVTA
ncbi:MAG: acylphosphatase [Candidatus Woesearchaeota archaeon]